MPSHSISHIHPRALSLTHTVTPNTHSHVYTHRHTQLFHGGMQHLSPQTLGTYQLTHIHTYTDTVQALLWNHMRMWTSLCVAQDVGQVVKSTVYVLLGLLLGFLHPAQMWSSNRLLLKAKPWTKPWNRTHKGLARENFMYVYCNAIFNII